MKYFIFPFATLAFLLTLIFSGALNNPSPFAQTTEVQETREVLVDNSDIIAEAELNNEVEEAYLTLDTYEPEVEEGTELEVFYVESTPHGQWSTSEDYLVLPSITNPEVDYIYETTEVPIAATEVEEETFTASPSEVTEAPVVNEPLTCEAQGMATAEDLSCVNLDFWNDMPQEPAYIPAPHAEPSPQEFDCNNIQLGDAFAGIGTVCGLTVPAEDPATSQDLANPVVEEPIIEETVASEEVTEKVSE